MHVIISTAQLIKESDLRIINHLDKSFSRMRIECQYDFQNKIKDINEVLKTLQVGKEMHCIQVTATVAELPLTNLEAFFEFDKRVGLQKELEE